MVPPSERVRVRLAENGDRRPYANWYGGWASHKACWLVTRPDRPARRTQPGAVAPSSRADVGPGAGRGGRGDTGPGASPRRCQAGPQARRRSSPVSCCATVCSGSLAFPSGLIRSSGAHTTPRGFQPGKLPGGRDEPAPQLAALYPGHRELSRGGMQHANRLKPARLPPRFPFPRGGVSTLVTKLHDAVCIRV